MNIRDVLNQLGVPFKEHGSSPHVTPGWIGLVCPFCGRGSSNFGLGINLRTNKVTCWKCGTHGLASALAEAVGDWRPVRAALGELSETATPRTAERPAGKYTEPPGVVDLLTPHRRYLQRRGFDPDVLVRLWGVGAIGPGGGRLKWRLFFPVVALGERVSWTTRAIGSAELRYVAARPEQESRPLKHCLFGEQLCRHAIVVTEGPFDAMRIGPGAVATFGLSHTPVQVARIARYAVRVIAFDNDREAQRRAARLADDLAVFPGQTHVARFSGKDPDTSPPDEIEEIRERFLAA